VTTRAPRVGLPVTRSRKVSIALRQSNPTADESRVTMLARLLSTPASVRSALVRRRTLTAAAAAIAAAGVLLSAAAPAGAVVTTIGSTIVGLQPREAQSFFEGMPTAESFNNPAGNLVLHKNETYAIYWDPTDHYHGDWQHLIDTFFQGLGADSGATGTVFAVDSQYTDKSDLPASYLSTFRGAYTDTDPYPTGAGNCTDPHPLAVPDRIGPEVVKGSKEHTEVCLTDAEIRTELKVFIAAHGLEKGVGSIFYLLTPPAVTVCLQKEGELGKANHCSDHTGPITETGTESYKNSFCSYHSDFSDLTLANTTTPDGNTVLYGVIPWSAGGLGDYHLTGGDQTPAYDCQDGGWYYNSGTSAEEKESSKVDPKEEEAKRHEEEAKKRATAEAEETQKQSTYEEAYSKKLITEEQLKEKEAELKEEKEARIEKEAEEAAKAAITEKDAREKKEKLEGPHQQEPNQIGLGPDGSYDTGLADLIVSQIGVQQQNIVTDPLLNAWQDSAHNEVTDECRNFFLPYAGGSVTTVELTYAGTLYNQSFAGANAYVNDAFNLAAGRLPYPGVPCMTGIDLVPQFTAPNPINAGELVGFDGMESDITLNDDIGYSKTGAEEPKYATYKWNFGDGTPEVTGVAPGAPSLNSPETSPCALPWEAPCDGSTFHSYQYGGEYQVTLTVTDTGGNTASVTHTIVVAGTRPPNPSLPGGTGTTAGGTTTSSGSTTQTGAGGSSSPGTSSTVVPAPVAAAAILRQSLRKALRKGLVVSYSVNEQVAGRFEVLLSTATARRLGISGTPATGMPAGSPPQLVIAKAILVTTKGGHNAVHILFSKRTAARLAQAHKVALTLRMIVRNAASSNPATTTVVSAVTLGG
jgi:hypothetical protein